MSDLTAILEANNTMPWFVPPTPVLTTFDIGAWATSILALDVAPVIPGEHESFGIVEPSSTIIGYGAMGAAYPQVPGYDYRPIPWSKRMIILSPDVLVLIRVVKRGGPHLREVVKQWLTSLGIATSYDPQSNDMLVNNRKFLGVQVYDSPVGWKTEFAMMTIHKDETLFDTVLPEKFRKNARGYRLTGLADEVDIDLVEALPSLYSIERGDI